MLFSCPAWLLCCPKDDFKAMFFSLIHCGFYVLRADDEQKRLYFFCKFILIQHITQCPLLTRNMSIILVPIFVHFLLCISLFWHKPLTKQCLFGTPNYRMQRVVNGQLYHGFKWLTSIAQGEKVRIRKGRQKAGFVQQNVFPFFLILRVGGVQFCRLVAGSLQ